LVVLTPRRPRRALPDVRHVLERGRLVALLEVDVIRVDPVAVHDHPEPSRLTIGCPACIQIAHPSAPRIVGQLSADARRTANNNALLARGIHPATHQTLHPDPTLSCAGCTHHNTVRLGKTYHKCERHRLGQSNSGASDIRVGWPACAYYKPVGADQ
jgi:hypothetical protein